MRVRASALRLAAVLGVVCGASLPAAAQNLAAYAQRFEAECAACHGPQGRSAMALTPSLAGQPSFYAISQLFLFREGRRDNAVMVAVAKGMSNDDLRGFSDLIGKLPPPALPDPAAADAARVARGQALAQQRRCTACHGTDLAGGQQVPRLAHQREDYLAQALRGFRAGTRLGYTQAMADTLTGLSPTDLDDVAHYMANMPVR